jgi:hypothetical protein
MIYLRRSYCSPGVWYQGYSTSGFRASSNSGNSKQDILDPLSTITSVVSQAPSPAIENTQVSITSSVVTPSSWPEEDGHSSSIIRIHDYGTRKIYPRNRLMSFTSGSFNTPFQIARFKQSLNEQFPGAIDQSALNSLHRRKVMRIRLMGDLAPRILDSQSSGSWMKFRGKRIIFHPMLFSPIKPTVQFPPQKSSNQISIHNLCLGWSVEEFKSCISKAFESLELKGGYRDVIEQTGFGWTTYHFLQFDLVEDVEKVIQKYGYEAVERNPGSGIVFEMCELWIWKHEKVEKLWVRRKIQNR